MIDLCFGNAMKGCLLHAKSYRASAAVQTEVIFFYEGEETPSEEEQERARKIFQEQREREQRLWGDLYGPLDGSREDIVCLNVDASLGDCSDLPGLDELKTRVEAGESIRVWDDRSPFTHCGLLFVVEALESLPCEILVVSLPERYTRKDGVVIQWRGWPEMEPSLLGHFAAGAKPLTREERGEMARQWRSLREENAPLRVLEGGEVRSAPIDYYDDRIRQVLPLEPCRAGKVIVEAMIQQNIPHGDEFIGQRLRVLIDAGELRLLEENKEMFSRSVIGPVE